MEEPPREKSTSEKSNSRVSFTLPPIEGPKILGSEDQPVGSLSFLSWDGVPPAPATHGGESRWKVGAIGTLAEQVSTLTLRCRAPISSVYHTS